MEFLGIGPLEIVFILVIILLVVGPKDLERTARTLGRGLNKLYRSENYRMIQRASQELRHLPQRLAREAQLKELDELKTLKDEVSLGRIDDPFKAWKEELPPKDAPPAAPGAPDTSPAPPLDKPQDPTDA
jgi:sec-independent protein translocase protein TatB